MWRLYLYYPFPIPSSVMSFQELHWRLHHRQNGKEMEANLEKIWCFPIWLKLSWLPCLVSVDLSAHAWDDEVFHLGRQSPHLQTDFSWSFPCWMHSPIIVMLLNLRSIERVLCLSLFFTRAQASHLFQLFSHHRGKISLAIGCPKCHVEKISVAVTHIQRDWSVHQLISAIKELPKCRAAFWCSDAMPSNCQSQHRYGVTMVVALSLLKFRFLHPTSRQRVICSRKAERSSVTFHGSFCWLSLKIGITYEKGLTSNSKPIIGWGDANGYDIPRQQIYSSVRYDT